MDFVKSLSMFHVDAKEIPCLTGEGAPTEKTEGAPGVLYMDTDTGTLYKCTGGSDGVYTWEKIGGGNSEYKLPIAGENLGGVKNGGNVVINPDGTMTATGSGSSHTDDYRALSNKPKINGVELTGDKTSADLGIGNPTNEQVATAVQGWLDEHPEATTTVADGSVTEPKLADGAVSARKAGFLTYEGNSENLFNMATTTDGHKIYQAAPYGMIADASMCVSDFIPVEEKTEYCRSATSFEPTGEAVSYQYTFYCDADKNILSASLQYHGTKKFTTPAGCAYIRINLPLNCKNIAMVVKGDTEPGEYIPYQEFYRLGDSVRISTDNFESLQELWDAVPAGAIAKNALSADVVDEIDSVNPRIKTATQWNDVDQPKRTLTGRINVFEKAVKGVFDISSDISEQTVIVHGVNYFDMNDLVAGKINITTGAITTGAGFYTKHLIPVQPRKPLYWNRDYANSSNFGYLVFHYYDGTGNWLRSNIVGGNYYSQGFTPDEDVYFIRVYFEVTTGRTFDATAEKFQIADVKIGTTYDGYGVASSESYFGKIVYFPYVGYRIENGVLIGASDTFTLEEITNVSVYDATGAVEVTAPVEGFDKERLRNVVLKYGRYGGTDYVMARIFKSGVQRESISPRVVAFTPGGKTMATLAGQNDFVMAINAGVLNTDDNSCIGVVISDCVVVADHIEHMYSGSADVLGIDASGNLSSYAYETTTADMLAAGVVGAVSGKNTLIVDYAKYDIDLAGELLGDATLCTTKHPRTAIGQYANGDYMVFTCGGRTTNQQGMTCAEMQEIFVAEGLKYAYNLDGGGSCNMRYFKKELAPYTENRADPSYIVFE